MMFERIRNLREDLDLTQIDISKILNLHQRTYSRYENGEREIPLKVISQIADFHKTSVDYILGRTNVKTPYPTNKVDDIAACEIIKRLRLENKYSQKYMSELLHFSQATYSKYENNQHKLPLNVLCSLADIYNTSTDYLLNRTDVKTPYPKKHKKGIK